MSLSEERALELQELCRRFRVDVLSAIHTAQSGHPGGSLSVCEILTLLYQERMNLDASHPDDPNRDRVVLSKGHAAPMLYRNLIEKGICLQIPCPPCGKSIASCRATPATTPPVWKCLPALWVWVWLPHRVWLWV